jgi:pSer/pThr/pTyr-binding forkhead associated (FHA) protein
VIDVKSQPDGYDARHYLSLRGIGPSGDGQLLKVNLGETVVCGRSRWCDWSLKRSPGFLTAEKPAREEIRKSLPWSTTSRRHVKVTYVSPDMVEVENLSGNGTYVDGHLVDRVVLTDCRTKAHSIRMGPHGVTLELAPGALPI